MTKGNPWILKKCGLVGNQWTSNLALYLKMLVLVTAINVPNFMLVSKSAQFAWNFELCHQTIYNESARATNRVKIYAPILETQIQLVRERENRSSMGILISAKKSSRERVELACDKGSLTFWTTTTTKKTTDAWSQVRVEPFSLSRGFRLSPFPPLRTPVTQATRGSYRGILVMCDQLILFSVKREFRKLFFVTRDLKVLNDP